MTENTKSIQLGLMILTRNNFSLYTQDIKGFLTFTFPNTAVEYIEIVNEEELESQVKMFVESSKIPPAEITILLSPDITFEKEIKGGLEESADRQRFLDSLPFESVYKTIIPKGQKPQITVVNKLFIDGIIKAFTNLGFDVPRVIPYSFLEKISVQTLDTNTALEIIKKSESMRIYNMLDYKQIMPPSTPVEVNKKDKNESNGKKVYFLYTVLGISIIVLIYVILHQLGIA